MSIRGLLRIRLSNSDISETWYFLKSYPGGKYTFALTILILVTSFLNFRNFSFYLLFCCFVSTADVIFTWTLDFL
ncbi:hypothetical protein RIR_jg27905.t1 [Rhizophagus irregularis DAOM 181602=DAOM 197198]|nr:hypothetical protein RIR_jg27905.t1 [Rhizophagus irregularis DAOM 181602=DAOM 197198]